MLTAVGISVILEAIFEYLSKHSCLWITLTCYVMPLLLFSVFCYSEYKRKLKIDLKNCTDINYYPELKGSDVIGYTFLALCPIINVVVVFVFIYL